MEKGRKIVKFLRSAAFSTVTIFVHKKVFVRHTTREMTTGSATSSLMFHWWRVKADVCLITLQMHILPWVVFGNLPYVFQQDGTPCHTANIEQMWMANN